MITFYPRDIGRWRGVFDFNYVPTLVPSTRTDRKYFHNRYELIEFLKQHGAILTDAENERIEVIANNENIVIERIISYGNITPEGYWYNQDKNEWVLLLTGEAKLEFRDNKTVDLKAGDYIMIAAHQEHRVVYTSKEPNCVWLAFHFK